MRIIGWNIRAGGGQRVIGIADQLKRWRPDVVALMEFRATPPSHWLATELAAFGLTHQLTTACSTNLAANALLLASHYPLYPIRLQAEPAETGRWLLAAIEAEASLTIGVMHVPNYVTGKKQPFLDGIASLAQTWSQGAGILLGDTNSGLPGLDEETRVFTHLEKGWFEALSACGWVDVFRHLKGEERIFTWYSPNGRNGFRIDQAFLNPQLLPCLADIHYIWGAPSAGSHIRTALSDHAALILDLKTNE
jgi:exonuclease III